MDITFSTNWSIVLLHLSTNLAKLIKKNNFKKNASKQIAMKKLTIILTAASERAKAIKGTTPPSRPMAILTNQHKVNNVNKGTVTHYPYLYNGMYCEHS